MSQSDTWRWADDQGEQRLVTAEELRAALASGVLPPSTLVWRDGMDAWVPAQSVPEFANPPPVAAQAKPAAAAAKQPVAARPTSQAINASESAAAEKRTPSVAPPRPVQSGGKATTKTLRPSTGPAIPAPARVPAEAAKAPGPPRPAVVAARATPPKTVAPPPRAPSTSAIDKDWSITDDETTNVPGKGEPVPARPAPPVESPAPQNPPTAPLVAMPSRQNTARSFPPPQALLEHRETTESTTFQFSQNTFSRSASRPAPLTESEKASSNSATATPAPIEAGPPPSLMDAYAKHPSGSRPAPVVDPVPPTRPSPEQNEVDDDGIPHFVSKTTKLADHYGTAAPPPPMREPAPTTMLPEGAEEPLAAADPRQPHEVSRTIRLAADFLHKVLGPGGSTRTQRIDTSNNAGLLNGLMQIKPPPLPPPLSEGAQPQNFVRLPMGAPNAATSLALRQVQQPQQGQQAPAQPQLPLNALLMTGGLLITMVIGAFFVGRCSVKPNASNTVEAKTGIAKAFQSLKVAAKTPVKTCSVAKQPTRWAPSSSKSIPFELLALSNGKMAIGYAQDSDEAIGIEVTPSTGRVEKKYTDKTNSPIERVFPTTSGFFISTTDSKENLRYVVPVPGEKPFYVGLSDDNLAWAEKPSGKPSTLWSLSGESSLDSTRVISAAGGSYLVSLRRKAGIFAGVIGADHKAVGDLVQVTGSGGQVGKPMSGSNGREVAITFSDRTSDQSPWKIRIGRSAAGKAPQTTTEFATPAGGPGGDAEGPAITGLDDGRWVLVWTEGSSGSRTIRAQTFDSKLAPAGAPITVSAPSGNFGRSIIGSIGNTVTIVFLQKSRSNYELWGSVLQCG